MIKILTAIKDGPFLKDQSANDPYWEYPSLLGIDKSELNKIITEWPNGIEDKKIQSIILSCIGILLSYPHSKTDQLHKWTGMNRKEIQELSDSLHEKGWEVL